MDSPSSIFFPGASFYEDFSILLVEFFLFRPLDLFVVLFFPYFDFPFI